MTTIMAVDPGDTTGVVTYDTDTQELLHTFEAASLNDLRKFVFWLPYHPEVVVVEDFIIRPGYAKAFVGNKLVAVQIIGALKWEFINPILQPASIKQAWPDCRVEKRLGYPMRGFSTHVRDAARHLCYYLKKEGL